MFKSWIVNELSKLHFAFGFLFTSNFEMYASLETGVVTRPREMVNVRLLTNKKGGTRSILVFAVKYLEKRMTSIADENAKNENTW